MRHRRKGRVLGRCPSHQLALFRNLATALFLTERDAEHDDNKPKVKGRIITTLEKAKEVRPARRKGCITLAVRGLAAEDDARPYATTAERNTRRLEEMAQERRMEEMEPGHRSAGQCPPPGIANAGRQAGRAGAVFDGRAPIHRSAGRLHPDPAAGQAALGRRRHPGDFGIRRRSRSDFPALPGSAS